MVGQNVAVFEGAIRTAVALTVAQLIQCTAVHYK